MIGQLLTYGLGEQQSMAQSLGTYVGDAQEAPGSWHWIGSAPAIMSIWRVNQ